MSENYTSTSMIITILRKIHARQGSLRLALVSQRKKFHPTDNAYWDQVYSTIVEIEKKYITINFIQRFFLQKNFRSIKSYLDLVTYWYFWEIKSSESIHHESKKFFFASNKEKRLFWFYFDTILKYSLQSIIDNISDPAEKWSINFSLPVLLYSHLSSIHSHKELALLGKWFNTPSLRYIWINNRENEYQSIVDRIKKKISLLEVQSVHKSFIVSGSRPIQQLEEYKSGNILIQDLGATIMAQLIPKIEGTIIDLCASPGNKTVQIFDKYSENDNCTLIAGDLPGSRFSSLLNRISFLVQSNTYRILKDNAEHLKITRGSKSLLVRSWDGMNLPFQENFADLIFIDAPCTGTGTLGTKPDVRSQFTDEFLQKHIAIQRALLEESYRINKSHGYIFYSTCSLLLEENEQQIKDFLFRHQEYIIVPLKHYLNYPNLLIEGSIKLFPPMSKTDGFFGVLLQKQL